MPVKSEMRKGFARVIADDADNVDRHFPDAPAVEQVGQAMVVFRDEDQHPGVVRLRAHLPGHVELLREHSETRLPRLDVGVRLNGIEFDPHEEQVGVLLVELPGIRDVEPAFKNMAGDAGDDARPVGAVQQQVVDFRMRRKGGFFRGLVLEVLAIRPGESGDA